MTNDMRSDDDQDDSVPDDAESSSPSRKPEPATGTVAELTGKEILRNREGGGWLSRLFSGWMARSQIESNAAIDRAQARGADARSDALEAGTRLAGATERAHKANARLRHIQENLGALQEREKLRYDAEHEEDVAELEARISKARLRRGQASEESDVLREELEAQFQVRRNRARQRIVDTAPTSPEDAAASHPIDAYLEELESLKSKRDEKLRQANSQDDRDRINAVFDAFEESLRAKMIDSEGQ